MSGYFIDIPMRNTPRLPLTVKCEDIFVLPKYINKNKYINAMLYLSIYL
jgi:hypothetical protein